MKLLRTSTSSTIASLAVFIGSTPLLAQGTWNEVSKHKLNEERYSQFVHYIDMKSIVNRDGLVYFNWNIKLYNKEGIALNKNLNENVQDGKINCKEKTAYLSKRDGGSWTPIEKEMGSSNLFNFWNSAYPIVCNSKKSIFKFW
tara:strand:+ start:1135 stop:1563 length:429 start_codon:yes stop_codon:yes gene_type:complete